MSRMRIRALARILPRSALQALAPLHLLPHNCHYVSVPKPPPSSSATESTAPAHGPHHTEEDPRAASLKPTPRDRSLPAPSEGGEPIILDVSGSDNGSSSSSAKLSHLGPLVVNVDGTLARITNWAQMTHAERDTTVRMIGKRNRERLEAVKRKESGRGG